MLVLIFRDTAAMGTLLVLHLGILGGLYVTAPYGKFAHVVYRYGALVRNRVEARREEAAEAPREELAGAA
jgi:citrate/tricarballylate utilization protein